MVNIDPININSENNITLATSLEPIINTLGNSPINTLVMFDIDEVLVIAAPEDDFRHPYRQELLNETINGLNKEETEIIESVILASRHAILIDQNIHKVFDLLQTKNIPTIGLTAMGAGPFGNIDSLEEFRHNELNNLGIYFNKLTPLIGRKIAEKLDLTNIPLISKVVQGIPTIDSGIIFTAGLDKGTILEFMLQEYQYFPEKLILIDDLLINLKSVQLLSKKLNIDFQGFHYTAEKMLALPDLDPKLEQLRFSILKQQHLWLSYKELEQYS